MSLLGFDRDDGARLGGFVRAAVEDRYLGSRLGLLWSILNPLLLLGLFTFVFTFVLKSRLPGSDSSLAFAIWLVSGYAPWLAISEGITAATNSVVGAGELVKNLVFKNELLPLAAVLVGAIPMAVGFVFLGMLLAIDGRAPDWHVVTLVVLVVVQLMLVAGVGMALASLNVYFRDLGVVLPNVLLLFLFATPIFYDRHALPRSLQFVALANPIYLLGDAYRSVLLDHRFPSGLHLGYLVALSVVAFIGGLLVFRRLKLHFHARL